MHALSYAGSSKTTTGSYTPTYTRGTPEIGTAQAGVQLCAKKNVLPAGLSAVGRQLRRIEPVPHAAPSFVQRSRRPSQLEEEI